MTAQFDLMLRLEALARDGKAQRDRSEPTPPPRAQTLEEARVVIKQLETALEHRTVISEAVGIAMERYSLTHDDAFALLTQLSNETNVKLYEIAGDIVSATEAALRRD